MSEIAEFLLARIAEDEAKAEAHLTAEVAFLRRDGVLDATRETLLTPAEGFDHRHWARPLAECEAKRRIVEACTRVDDPAVREFAEWDVLRNLVLPYADHPDYRQEWCP